MEKARALQLMRQVLIHIPRNEVFKIHWNVSGHICIGDMEPGIKD